jgi:hypothetical protein
MRPIAKLAGYRRRFNELAAAVGAGRELSRSAAQNARALRDELSVVGCRQAALEAQLGLLNEQMDSLVAAAHQQANLNGPFRDDVIRGLRRVHADEAWHRRRLRELRSTEEYQRAFTDPEPLISVLIPTYDRLELLRSRTIPSILAQEYRHLEIVIVGDDSPYGLAEIAEGFADAPISFVNLPLRGPYPDDIIRRWLVAGATPFNEAMASARGSWLAPFADDDAMRPHHLRTLLEAAKERQLEFVYGRLQMHFPEHGDPVLGSFPPKFQDIGLQAALLHGHMRLFELELADADFSVPTDWGRIERMLRAGVRTGMIDDIVADYFPSRLGMAGQ